MQPKTKKQHADVTSVPLTNIACVLRLHYSCSRIITRWPSPTLTQIMHHVRSRCSRHSHFTIKTNVIIHRQTV